jgi:hypothetical protein
MRAIMTVVLTLTLAASSSAGAQRVERLGVTRPAAPRAPVVTAAAVPANSGMPPWVRWGLVGAVGGAVLFVVADSNHSVGSRILSGAATGFVVVGGGVLLYDAVCGGSGPSAFCGR